MGWLKAFYHSVLYSMRRHLALTFLLLYTLAMFITGWIVFWGMVYQGLKSETEGHYQDVYLIVEQYDQGFLDADDLERTLVFMSLTNGYDLAFELDASRAFELDTSLEFKTQNYMPKNVGINRIEYVQGILKDQVYYRFYETLIEGTQTHLMMTIQYPLALAMTTYSFMWELFLISYVIGVFILWFLGTISIRKMVHPLYTMTATAKSITMSNMDERIDVQRAKYELKDLAMTLNDMIDRLQDDYVKQKRFVSDVSHELRTPISIVNGYANMLERWGKQDPVILDEAIEAIISEAKSMQSLVEHLLTLVRSDNQTLAFTPAPFALDELLLEVCKETKMINVKNQQIVCNIRANMMLTADLQMIKQMVRIFVDNAIKYTPEGGTIQIRGYESENKCMISIQDTGIGIDQKDLPHLFERFYRSDASRTRQTGGHGLGLSIAKVIVLGHGGTIKVSSQLNKGSEFIITLPTQM